MISASDIGDRLFVKGNRNSVFMLQGNNVGAIRDHARTQLRGLMRYGLGWRPGAYEDSSGGRRRQCVTPHAFAATNPGFPTFAWR